MPRPLRRVGPSVPRRASALLTTARRRRIYPPPAPRPSHHRPTRRRAAASVHRRHRALLTTAFTALREGPDSIADGLQESHARLHAPSKDEEVLWRVVGWHASGGVVLPVRGPVAGRLARQPRNGLAG
ncbi:hypothetical protein PVAP13_9NG404856 [Panicum virgatum]|uniref:Uncharacterized protein n=1 Tax=Panicum virgatum TaxID=38727 RepID=A0A8T0MNJ9_PANVG|nr:hypothetical protein PVAP13_9NG404856 [Panicum virgatum]